MRQLPSRLRRLDDALAALPLEEPMLLTELDGFLHGVILSPAPIPPAEWLQNVWGSDEGGVAPFEDPADVRWFADAVAARRDEIVRDLDRGRPRPIFDVDERSGEVLWESWIDGFAEAMALRAESWAASIETPAADGASRLAMLVAVARDESDLDSVQINAVHDAAPATIAAAVLQLHAVRPRADAVPHIAAIKPGRNDPCPCGSGRKSKRCCA